MFELAYRIYFRRLGTKRLDDLCQDIKIRILNILLPVYFGLTGFISSYKLQKTPNNKELLIVSLTSFPTRISKVWLAVETLLRQKVKPDKIILWLFNGEFKGKESLPKNLLKLEERGLEIRFCSENLMPHLKYFYTMLEFPEANIITVDDDIYYPPDLIENLKYWHKIYPESIICAITRQILVLEGEIRPYKEWNYLHINTKPSFRNLTMGVGGTLYPKGSLHCNVFDVDVLKRLVLKTDDLWLKVMSLKNNTRIVSIAGEYSRFFIPIIFKNNLSLMDVNITGGNNDIVFKNLLEYFKINILDIEKE